MVWFIHIGSISVIHVLRVVHVSPGDMLTGQSTGMFSNKTQNSVVGQLLKRNSDCNCKL